MIKLDDIELPGAKKESRYTVVLTDADGRLVRELRAIVGSKNLSEIARRAVRAGISEALEKFKGKTG